MILLPIVAAGAKIATIGKKVDYVSLEPHLYLQDQHPTQGIRMHYLGTSCFLFSHRGKTLLTDPFFSNPGLMQLSTGRYKDQSHIIKPILERSDSISLITISHGHYDHCLDLPAFSLLFSFNATLVGDKSIYYGLSPHFRKHTSISGIVSPDISSDYWIYSRDSVFRVLPLASVHGNHFWNVKLFGGSHEGPLDALPGPVWQWKEGNTYSYVIDFMDGNSIFKRIFVGAGSLTESSMLRLALLNEVRQFDLLIPPYWHHKKSMETLLLLMEATDNAPVLLHHWNNFFSSGQASIQTIRSTKLERTLKYFRKKGESVFVMLPFTEASI